MENIILIGNAIINLNQIIYSKFYEKSVTGKIGQEEITEAVCVIRLSGRYNELRWEGTDAEQVWEIIKNKIGETK